jgi:RNA polymerase sigma factor (sigma-70 family)
MQGQAKVDYLKGIAENDFAVLQSIYQESLPEVIRYVKKNSGTADDAKDVFQEAILIIFKKMSEGELVLTTRFHVYLFSICRRLWLKKLKKNWKKEVPFEEEMEFGMEEYIEEQLLKTRKWTLFNKKFQQLSEECRKALKMLFDGHSSKEIAEAMGYTEDYAKRKKYKCKMQLAELIKKAPEYQALTGENNKV